MMRIAIVAALAFLATPAVASARDFAVGGGTFGKPSDPTGVQHVAFAASGGPSPSLPVRGHFQAHGAFDLAGATAFRQEGPVTCLVVEGNQARLVYPNRHARPEPNAAMEVLIFLEDNGPPRNGRPVDRLAFVLIPDESPDSDAPSEVDDECIPPPVTPTFVTLEKGNFTIRDGP
jgi:hypothetical protein